MERGLRFAVSWLVAAAFAAALAAASPAPLEIVEPPGDEILILALELERHALSDAFLAYWDGELLRVGLGEIAAALDFAIETRPGAGTAEGFFIAENRRFSLDLERRRAVVEGRVLEIPAGAAELHADGIYLSTEWLERLFPVDFELRLLESKLVVHSREPLPIERHLERQRRWSRLGAPHPATAGFRFPVDPLPYRLLDWPALDHSLTLSWTREERSEERGSEGEAKAGATRRLLRSNLLATGDLLFMNAELSVASTRGGGVGGGAGGGVAGGVAGDDVRLVLSRRDPGGGLLGPLGATSVALGDLRTPGRFLVSEEIYARGLEISNFPLDRPQEFDRTTLSGYALPGWEVELYHNEELVDFAILDDSGRYEFEDVPLYLGLNLLRLVFHGPQGQRQERLERFLIGPDLIRPGESFYRLAVHDNGRRLFPVRGPGGFGAPAAGAGVTVETLDPAAGLRLFAEIERGLRRELSFSARLQSFPLDDGERHLYGELGLLATRGGVLGRLDLVADAAGGWAGRLAAEGELPRWRWRFEHHELEDFVSEQSDVDDPLSGRTRAQVDGRVGRSGPFPLRIFLTAERQRRRSGGGRAEARARLAGRFRGLDFSHSLAFVERLGTAEEDERSGFEGGLLISGHRRGLRLRGGLTYALDDLDILRARLTVERRFGDAFLGRLRLDHALAEEVASSYTASLHWRFSRFAFGFDVAWRQPGIEPPAADPAAMSPAATGPAATMPAGRFDLRLNWTTSLRRGPLSRRLRPDSRPAAALGSAAVRVFLDRDLDGRFGDGDEPLSGAVVKAGGGRKATTDDHGVAFLAHLEADRRIDVTLELGSLEDPYWTPRRPGIGLVARPGRVAVLEFPVVESGEIDGTISLERHGKEIPLAKVVLQLVDENGTVVRSARSAYDGFYLVEKVPPGSYLLRLEPGQLEDLDLAAPPPREIRVGGGEIVAGIDFVLGR